MRLESILVLGLALGTFGCGVENKDDKAKEDEVKPAEDEKKDPPVVGSPDYSGASLEEIQVTQETKSAASPKLLFNGTNYSMVWDSDNGKHLKFGKVGLDGKMVGTPVDVYSSTNQSSVISDGRIDFAQAGDKYLAAFQVAGVSVGIFDKDGTVATPFEVINSLGGFPAVASDGTKFALVYADNKAASSPSKIIFTAIGADGTKGNPFELSTSKYSFNPKIAWNSTSKVFGIVWEQQPGSRSKPYETWFASVDADGKVVTAAKAVTGDDGYDSRSQDIVAYGDGFALLFRDSRKMKIGDNNELNKIPQIRLSILDSKGAITDITGDSKVDEADEYLISNPYIELAKSGEFAVDPNGELGIVWSTQEEPRTIYFSQAKLVSGKITHTVRSSLVKAGEIAERPQIASSGASKYFVVWMDPRGEGSYQIFGAK